MDIDAAVRLRGYRESDFPALEQLVGPTLVALYPGHAGWLRRRLDAVLDGHARCELAIDGRTHVPVGVTISVHKSPTRAKLCTLFVAEPYRRRGIALMLVEALHLEWAASGVTEAHVTVALERLKPLQTLLAPFGFLHVATEPFRYGPDRHEAVLTTLLGAGAQAVRPL